MTEGLELDVWVRPDPNHRVMSIVQGEETTLPVTLEESIYHTRIVARGARRALVVADMPFGSYQVSPEEAVRNAIRFVKEAGAHAVKLEGGSAMLHTTERIVSAGIPVIPAVDSGEFSSCRINSRHCSKAGISHRSAM